MNPGRPGLGGDADLPQVPPGPRFLRPDAAGLPTQHGPKSSHRDSRTPGPPLEGPRPAVPVSRSASPPSPAVKTPQPPQKPDLASWPEAPPAPMSRRVQAPRAGLCPPEGLSSSRSAGRCVPSRQQPENRAGVFTSRLKPADPSPPCRLRPSPRPPPRESRFSMPPVESRLGSPEGPGCGRRVCRPRVPRRRLMDHPG